MPLPSKLRLKEKLGISFIYKNCRKIMSLYLSHVGLPVLDNVQLGEDRVDLADDGADRVLQLQHFYLQTK